METNIKNISKHMKNHDTPPPKKKWETPKDPLGGCFLFEPNLLVDEYALIIKIGIISRKDRGEKC